MKSKRPGPIRDRVLLIILGIIMLSIVAWIHTQQVAFASTGKITTGTVTEVVRKSKGYYPVIQFLTSEGRPYTFESSTGGTQSAYKVGDKIDIMYNPESPEQAVIAATNSIMTNSTLQTLTVVGLMLVLFGAYPLAKSFKEWRERPRTPSDDVSSPVTQD